MEKIVLLLVFCSAPCIYPVAVTSLCRMGMLYKNSLSFNNYSLLKHLTLIIQRFSNVSKDTLLQVKLRYIRFSSTDPRTLLYYAQNLLMLLEVLKQLLISNCLGSLAFFFKLYFSTAPYEGYCLRKVWSDNIQDGLTLKGQYSVCPKHQVFKYFFRVMMLI